MIAAAAWAVESPVIPIGYDAYRQWDRWPHQRIGARTYMRSTYDRSGGNEGADASHFLYQLAEDQNVTLDIQAPGILYFVRYNHWHGSPWHYEIDGVDHVVQETSTANPNHPNPNSLFLPEKAFPNPLTWTWSMTKGADLSWVPIPFERSFRMAYSRTHYGTGYYIYQQFVPGAKLSQPIRSWDPTTPPPADVLDLLRRAGTDLVGAAGSPAGRRLKLSAASRSLELPANASRSVIDLTNAPSMIRALEFSVPREQAVAFGHARLRIFWDNLALPSVDAPVALFFGAGTLYNRDDRSYFVKAFPVNVHFDPQTVHLACYFPMPFFHSAHLELTNTAEVPLTLNWSVRHAPFKGRPEEVGYFHATYRDHPCPEIGKDLVLLDSRETEGGGDWSGSFVGTSFIFSDRAALNTLEGDPRFFFDDSQTPQAYGTGTEEWCGGGDYWGGQNMTLPFAGHPAGAPSTQVAKNKEDQIESAYRFLLADLMPFGKRALIRLEHGGRNESLEHYQTVAYWYGLNRASLVKTDTLKIGDLNSEAQHNYVSPEASAPYELTSRYEWGVDTFDGQVIYPAQTDTGRTTTGVSEFDLQLDPNNLGVMLRRKLDYKCPNQRAEVFVASVQREKVGSFKPAGVWYLAGSSTCIYSNPNEELGPARHIVERSNRRFRDDEFLLPLRLTRGCSKIRLRIKFAPVHVPLFPGAAPPELAWSEMRYEAYCFRMPRPEFAE
ncbi:MAG TPA: DUF2961 domain-containing protein [Candidatus Limnocylindrales bacterium]|jgi:hypothetical protein|nr:DUF2961 domain-containing protein [Candidatus Limnocylindrales bacterium]